MNPNRMLQYNPFKLSDAKWLDFKCSGPYLSARMSKY